MEDEVRNSLEAAILGEFSTLESFENESKEKTFAVDNLVKLYRLRIDEDRNNWDYDEKFNRRKMDEKQHETDEASKTRELDIKERQIREQAVDRWANVAIQVGVTLLGIVAYDRWFKRGLKFEETGTIGAPMTKNLISKMLPKR